MRTTALQSKTQNQWVFVDRKREQQLLNNALDALDRLFDGDCGVVDVWALFVATSEALRETPHYVALAEPLAELEALKRVRGTREALRDRALTITDSVRLYLANQFHLREQ